jgi:hypothetical protein
MGGSSEDAYAGADGEALGRGGRGARWWWGGARRRRKHRSTARQWGGGGGGSWGMRSSGVGLVGWAERGCTRPADWAHRGLVGAGAGLGRGVLGVGRLDLGSR